MSEQLLHRTDVVPVLQQVGGERMPEGVRGRAPDDPGPARGVLDRPLEDGLVQMMPAELAGEAVAVETRGREDPLPGSFSTGVRVLPQQRRRQFHPATAPRQIVLVLGASDREMPGEVTRDDGWEHGDTVLVALAASHGDLISR